MEIEKTARATLTAVEMNPDDTLLFTLASGITRKIRVLRTSAEVYQSNLASLAKPGPLAKVVLRMEFHIEIDGCPIAVNRYVGNQQSFYEPWELLGMRIWFDACDKLFEHVQDNHGGCRPRKELRLAVQDATLGICPELLHPWCPLPAGGLRIEEAYQGSDCWMGPYFGNEAHGGLDINHPAGTPIWTPISVDHQAYFDSLATGANNNRWRAIRRWDDGSQWLLQVHHMLRLRVQEGAPLHAGVLLADAAGALTGTHEHSHFVFGIIEPGESFEQRILLDPWILFWQMYKDRQRTIA